jgi:hypothetical protein
VSGPSGADGSDVAMTSEASPHADATRGFVRAFAAGTVISVVTFAFMVTNWTLDFGRRIPFGGDFYDAQAHSLLSGTLDMPASVVRLEGFRYHGHLVTYFGPFPAFLRLPTAALTHALDGRTGRIAMLLAFVVAMIAGGRLLWRARRWVRGDAPWTGAETWTTAAAAVVFGVGSCLLFLGSGPFVYHEAIIWGVAFSLAAFDAILGWIEQPRTGVLVLAGVFALCSITSRLAVGLGPAVLLGMLLAISVLRRWRPIERLQPHIGLDLRTIGTRAVVGLAVALVVPLAVYAVFNMIKFGTPFSVPYGRQVASSILPERAATLAANGGSLFNVKALATNLWAYVRPDAIGFTSSFPWIALPTTRATVIGDLRYDFLDYTPSLVTSMPVIVAFAVTGAVAVVRAPARVMVATARSFSLPVMAAVAAVLPTLVIVYITPRYLADFFPALVVPGVVGFQVFLAWAFRAERRALVRAVTVGVAVLALWGCVANIAIARQYQDEHGADFFATPITR